MNYKWPLNISNFTWSDRLKICGFFLNPKNFWTMNKYVQKFEKEMAAFMGFQYAIFVSSGSTANTILAMYLRDKLKKESSIRNIIVLPSTTWQTSCSPWIREGFEPYFIDVNLTNFGMSMSKLHDFLFKNYERVAAVFPTSLLGFNLDYAQLNSLKQSYHGVEFFIDQCENNFGGFDSLKAIGFDSFTSTTSTYMGHEIQSVEGGFVFTNGQAEYENFLMYRNHGMVRSLNGTDVEPAKSLYKNHNVDERFDFYSLGNNFRNSDVNAFLGLLDFKRRFEYIKKRRKLYSLFFKKINIDRYILPPYGNFSHVPFCLPIICKGETSKERLAKIKDYCAENGIETRPIISGFLGYQTAYQGMMDEKDYPNSIYLHNNGIYLGLHTKLKKSQIIKLTKFLNEI